MTKIQVPEGMLKAALDVYWGAKSREEEFPAYLLQAALQWLSEHPIVPTIKQINEMYDSPDCPKEGTYIPYYLKEWQRSMFLAEPEIPKPVNATVFVLEELLDLAETLLPTDKDRLAHIKQVLEAERSKPLAEPEPTHPIPHICTGYVGATESGTVHIVGCPALAGPMVGGTAGVSAPQRSKG